MSKYRELCEGLVAAASPKFRDFRVDFEKISNAASKMCRTELADNEAAAAMFLDVNCDLRLPLQRRYIEHGAMDPVAHYHAKQFKLLLGRNAPWPDDLAQDALRLFAEHGRPDIGVELIRTYADMQHKRIKRDFSARNPRGPREVRDEGTTKVIAAISQMIADAIPDRKADLLRNLETVSGYLDQHASTEDRDWFEQLRREIWMERRA